MFYLQTFDRPQGTHRLFCMLIGRAFKRGSPSKLVFLLYIHTSSIGICVKVMVTYLHIEAPTSIVPGQACLELDMVCIM